MSVNNSFLVLLFLDRQTDPYVLFYQWHSLYYFLLQMFLKVGLSILSRFKNPNRNRSENTRSETELKIYKYILDPKIFYPKKSDPNRRDPIRANSYPT